jgi:hypothetical protein
VDHGIAKGIAPMTTLEEIWPVFGLRVEAGPIELSAICDDDMPILVDLASDGIHEPDADRP